MQYPDNGCGELIETLLCCLLYLGLSFQIMCSASSRGGQTGVQSTNNIKIVKQRIN